MATFITSLILYGFIAFVIGAIGKLIYEVQQNKKKEKEADYKKQFQKLAGIGQPKNEIDPEIWKYIADKVSKEGFPEPDASIPFTTAKLTTIETKFEDYDPLTSVPMSRVSKEAKKKMAEIAKEDIKEQVEKQASIFPESVEYTDEYFKPDYSKSEMPNEIKEALLKAPSLKPKKKSNPKQMDGILIEEPNNNE
jgi:hypothetical protein